MMARFVLLLLVLLLVLTDAHPPKKPLQDVFRTCFGTPEKPVYYEFQILMSRSARGDALGYIARRWEEGSGVTSPGDISLALSLVKNQWQNLEFESPAGGATLIDASLSERDAPATLQVLWSTLKAATDEVRVMVTHMDKDHIGNLGQDTCKEDKHGKPLFNPNNHPSVLNDIKQHGVLVDYNFVSRVVQNIARVSSSKEYATALEDAGYSCEANKLVKLDKYDRLRREYADDLYLRDTVNGCEDSLAPQNQFRFHFRSCAALPDGNTLLDYCEADINYGEVARFTTWQPTADSFFCDHESYMEQVFETADPGSRGSATSAPVKPTTKITKDLVNLESLIGVIGPILESPNGVTNECSVLFGLLSGDTSTERIKQSVDFTGEIQTLWFFKIPHHGSQSDPYNRESQFTLIKAYYYLFSGTAKNHGNPKLKTLAHLVKSRRVPLRNHRFKDETPFYVVFTEPQIYEDKKDVFADLFDTDSKVGPTVNKYGLFFLDPIVQTPAKIVLSGLYTDDFGWTAVSKLDTSNLIGIDCNGASPCKPVGRGINLAKGNPRKRSRDDLTTQDRSRKDRHNLSKELALGTKTTPVKSETPTNNDAFIGDVDWTPSDPSKYAIQTFKFVSEPKPAKEQPPRRPPSKRIKAYTDK